MFAPSDGRAGPVRSDRGRGSIRFGDLPTLAGVCLVPKVGSATIGGERTEMAVGDFAITPSWEWHDHGNISDAPIFWLDGLDIPLVQFLDASFAGNLGDDERPVGRVEGDSLARYGTNMLPGGYEKRTPTSPIFNCPHRLRHRLH